MLLVERASFDAWAADEFGEASPAPQPARATIEAQAAELDRLRAALAATNAELEALKAAQVLAAGDTPGRRWTVDALAELAQYREQHGTKAAAEWAAITEQRVRQLLPGEAARPAAPTANNPFPARNR